MAAAAVSGQRGPAPKVVPSGPAPDAFDVLVIGGGATGTGVALDAALRDLNVALVERDDFASGSSSRSTKLIHGGVRYLEKAFFQLDPSQLKLVFEALSERSIMLSQAPHLTRPLPTILPCYKLWEVPFYRAGLLAYDIIAYLGHGLLYLSKFVPAGEALRLFPTLASKAVDGKQLRGTIVYYDGQMNDARFATSLALTAALHGAKVANHTEVVGMLHDENGKAVGATVKDLMTGETFDVRAKVVINATGPFTDGVRKLSNSGVRDMIAPSSGVHVTLPEYYSPDGMGLIVPKTKDGRVVFMLPWMGSTIAGTTDSSVKITANPQPHEDEIAFILDALSDYLTVEVRRKDVKSAWSGIRPLAMDPDAKPTGNTQNILREHAVHVSTDNVVTITGGKWTTYRKMAEDALDRALAVTPELAPKASKCKTEFVQLVGAHKWDPSYFTFLAQRYERVKYPVKSAAETALDKANGIDHSNHHVYGGLLGVDVAQHLSTAYGDQAYKVAELAERGYGKKLAHNHPLLEAEVIYTIRYEYCLTASDFLARRSRLAFLDAKAAVAAAPRVIELMAQELGWDKARVAAETKEIAAFLNTFTAGKKEPYTAEEVAPASLMPAAASPAEDR